MALTRKLALVAGCGVSGLTCAVRLLEEGWAVRIVTSRLPHETTSGVAAALWYPYRALPDGRVAAWGLRGLARFREIMKDPSSGISMIDLHEIFIGEAPPPDWRKEIDGYRPLRPRELPAGYGSGYVLRVPLIETPIYLPWLMNRIEREGGTIEHRTGGIASFDEVSAEADLVVNCTGLGARALCGDDDLRPVRGQLVSVESGDGPGHAIVDEDNPIGATYAIPRSRDCILGTTYEIDDWDLTPRESATDAILSRASVIEPAVAGRRILAVRVGLRPGRSKVRVERETLPDGTPVVHDYGHGGAGISLSWGCADDVAALAAE